MMHRTCQKRVFYFSGSELVKAAQLARRWFPGLAISSAFFQVKYTEAVLSNSTRKLLRFEIAKTLIAVLKTNFMVSFIVIFSTLSFCIGYLQCFDAVGWAAGRASGL